MRKVLLTIFTLFFAFSIFAAEERENTISIDFRDAPIEDVLRTIAKQSGYNIIMSQEVKGNITIHLKDVTPEQAIDVVSSINGFTYVRKGNIFKIITAEAATQENTTVEVYRLKYITAIDAWRALRNVKNVSQQSEKVTTSGENSGTFTISKIEYGDSFIIENVTVGIDESKNALILFGLPKEIENIKKILKGIDKPTRTILIDALIVEVNCNEGEQLGIDWNITASASGAKRPTTFPFTAKSQELDKYYPKVDTSSGEFPADNPFGFPFAPSDLGTDADQYFNFGTLDFSSLSSVLHFLKTKTSAHIVSHPRIVTLDGRLAKIQVGDIVPVPHFTIDDDTGNITIDDFDYRDTGVILYVKPEIIGEDTIRLQVHPQISSVSEDNTLVTGGVTIPSFSTRQTDVEINLKDGYTLAIGGLMKNNQSTTVNKIPFLGDIPVVGRLFSYTNKTDPDKTELLIFITIHILGNNKDVPLAKLDRFTRRDLRKAIKNYHVNFGNLGREEIKPKRGIKNRKSIKLNRK